MQPTNPAITIVGGSGGYILVDEKRVSNGARLVSLFVCSESAPELVHGRVSTAVGLSPSKIFHTAVTGSESRHPCIPVAPAIHFRLDYTLVLMALVDVVADRESWMRLRKADLGLQSLQLSG